MKGDVGFAVIEPSGRSEVMSAHANGTSQISANRVRQTAQSRLKSCAPLTVGAADEPRVPPGRGRMMLVMLLKVSSAQAAVRGAAGVADRRRSAYQAVEIATMMTK